MIKYVIALTFIVFFIVIYKITDALPLKESLKINGLADNCHIFFRDKTLYLHIETITKAQCEKY